MNSPSAHGCHQLCVCVCVLGMVAWRDQYPELSFVTARVFSVAVIKVACKACCGVIPSGSAAAAAVCKLESAVFG